MRNTSEPCLLPTHEKLHEQTRHVAGLALTYRLYRSREADGGYEIEIAMSGECHREAVGSDLFFAVDLCGVLAEYAVTPTSFPEVMADFRSGQPLPPSRRRRKRSAEVEK